MDKLIQPPKGLTEAEEADWWYDHREIVEREFEQAFAEGQVRRVPVVPPSQRSVSTTIQLDPKDLKKVRAIAAKRGLDYEAFLQTLVHQALEEVTEIETADAA
jgi:predicted DNA binding CopG/RHH family protein